MKSHEIINELKCWSGYHRVKGRPAGSPGSCAKNTNEAEATPTAKPFSAPTPVTAPAAQPTSAATPVAKQAPQGSMSNMPGAKAYSAAADPMAATNAQYQQNMQNIQGEKDKRFLDHMAARDAATQKYGSVTKALSSGEVDALGPSGDPLQRSSVSTTDLRDKQRAAGQEYTAANKEKTGGGHWQYDKKTVASDMGPITQTTATRIATPTKGEVIRQGLQGGGSLYDRQSTLLDPNAPKAPPGATGLNPTGAAQPTGPAIQSATTEPTQPQQQVQPQQPVQEEETDVKVDQQKPEQQNDSRSSMRSLIDLITTVGRAATSMKGRDLGADIKQDVQTMIRNKVTGEPNK